MNILLTGGTGLIGSEFIRQYSHEHEFTVISRGFAKAKTRLVLTASQRILHTHDRNPAPTCSSHRRLAVRSAFELHGGHPSAAARQSLALQLGMTPKSVQVWFQARRSPSCHFHAA